MHTHKNVSELLFFPTQNEPGSVGWLVVLAFSGIIYPQQNLRQANNNIF